VLQARVLGDCALPRWWTPREQIAHAPCEPPHVFLVESLPSFRRSPAGDFPGFGVGKALLFRALEPLLLD
jgi:hypothetical protein